MANPLKRALPSTQPSRWFSSVQARLQAPQVFPNVWVRNPSWRALPTVTSSEQKFVGLLAVFPVGNFLALSAAGNYTVDWGDGVTENFSSGATAQHTYDFADADLANTNGPVTFTDSGDLVERTAHGYTNGMAVSFDSITTTTGITVGQIYYVINAQADSFQIAATPNGTAIALTNNGSGTLLPYKQAIVTVTPQSGQNLTSLNLNIRHNQSGLNNETSTGWLDIVISSTNLSSLTVMSSTINVRHSYLEQAALISTNTVTDFSYRFYTCVALRSVPTWIVRTTSTVNMEGMFNSCYSLQVVPALETSVVTNMRQMFRDCYSIQSVPLFNTAAVTNMNLMFFSCNRLESVPLFNTASVTNMGSMFYNCSTLQSVPLFNTAAVTTMDTMFRNCLMLRSVPLFNTASVTNMNLMFYNCNALESVPLFNTAAVTNMAEMFSFCRSLKSVPLFNTAAVTTMVNMFQECKGLQSIPDFDTAAVTAISGMFSGCTAIQYIPDLNVSAVTLGYANMFEGCRSLATLKAKEFKSTFSLINCKFARTQFEEVFTNLPRVTTQQTITISNNYGNPAGIAKASSGTTAGSKTVTISNTSSLEVGMLVTATGISDSASVTFQDAGDTVTRTGHGLSNDTIVWFSSITTTTGIITWTSYYVINVTANTFQLSTTLGGSAIALTNNGSGFMRYAAYIDSISTNVSITLTAPAHATGTVTVTARLLDISLATRKNWAVTL